MGIGIKVLITVRNRLGITQKSIEALLKHTKTKLFIHVYDNLTNYRLEEHFNYFSGLLKENKITQYTYNTPESTMGAFSKAVSSNQFGKIHEMDPEKDNYNFLLFMDNDMIVLPEWDKYFLMGWEIVNKKKLPIKVISQYPGGIKRVKELDMRVLDARAFLGSLGGSGFWTVSTDFYRDVGFLNLKEFVGLNKRHDQKYWSILSKVNRQKPYIMGIDCKKVLHMGPYAGSVCNVLTKKKKEKNVEELIKFKDRDDTISKLSFDEFMKVCVENLARSSRW